MQVTCLGIREGFDVEAIGFGTDPPDCTDYHQIWQYQREIHRRVAAGGVPPRLLFVQHAAVYTAGRATRPAERPRDGAPVVDVDRGGKITWHGPGQLVGYPILTLPDRVGALDYVRRLEQAVIDYLAELQVAAGRVPGRTGVWLAANGLRPERKICAIGVRVARRTTMHGFAVNLTNTLACFDSIIPCGIADAGVTNLAMEMANPPGLRTAAVALSRHLARLLRFEAYELTPDLPGTDEGIHDDR